MKKILITGEGSYIGRKFIEWVKQWPAVYQVDEISVRGDKWRTLDFSAYSVVIHLAAVVHKKENKNSKDIYYKVNRDLAFDVAKKAREDGVYQFIFMSTMNVYGLENGIIDSETSFSPKTYYGKSKLEAEVKLKTIINDNFKLLIIRPPMVYGPNCPGNYSNLSKFAKLTPIFPKINNQRSMIFIDNLSEFIRKCIDTDISGEYCPQNNSYVNVSELVSLINRAVNKKIFLTNIFNPLIHLLRGNTISKKIFGSLKYSKELSELPNLIYEVVSFEKSIYESEF